MLPPPPSLPPPFHSFSVIVALVINCPFFLLLVLMMTITTTTLLLLQLMIMMMMTTIMTMSMMIDDDDDDDDDDDNDDEMMMIIMVMMMMMMMMVIAAGQEVLAQIKPCPDQRPLSPFTLPPNSYRRPTTAVYVFVSVTPSGRGSAPSSSESPRSALRFLLSSAPLWPVNRRERSSQLPVFSIPFAVRSFLSQCDGTV